jgi:hypothetical protein
LIVGLTASQAWAEPDDGGLVAEAPALSLAGLGVEPAVAFYGAQGVQSLTLPVPEGLAPAFLDVMVEPPVNLASGTLTVMQDDRTLSRVRVPNADGVRLSIPMIDAVVIDNAVTVTLRSYLVPIEGVCFDPSNPLRLVDANIRYEGKESAPATVAEFLPPVLQQLNLFLPAKPTRTETDAAIKFATSVVARYGQQNTAVTVAPLGDGQTAPPGPSLPWQRQVVIREDVETGVRLTEGLGVPALLITGPAAELANQARLLSRDLGRLAISSKAVAGPLRSTPQLPPEATTLRGLGQPGLDATALEPQVSVGLDQTRLGRPAHDIRVRLLGSHTPLPSSIGGQLFASVGGQVVDRWPVDGTGTIDRWIDVPDRLLQRYTNLDVAIDISGDTGRCGEFQPISLTIDGDSPVVSTRANPPVPQGFQSLPQALMPRVDVGIGQDFDNARRAVGILVGLQRLSALPIDTAVMTVDEAIASPNPAVVIEAVSWTHDELTLPVAGSSDGELTVQNADGSGEASTLALEPALGFASLQTVHSGARTVLVATSNGTPAELDRLLNWLDSDAQRWPRLAGNTLISAPELPPVLVNVTAQPDQLALAGVAEKPFPAVAVGIVAAAAVAGALAVGLIVLRRRRSRSQP